MADQQIQLSLPLLPDYTRLCASLAEEAGGVFGLGRGESLKLSLATEEVFAHLCRSLVPGARLELELSGHVYYVRLRLRCGRGDVDFRLLNLAAGFSAERPEDLERLGLLLASRSVESFRLEPLGGQRMELVLDKHKAYPPPSRPAQPAAPLKEARLVEPGPGEIKELSRLLATHHPATAFPGDFGLPGKLADMALSGDYHLLAVADGQGGLGGMLAWRRDGNSVVIYGPYIFGQPDHAALGQRLTDECLARLAKSGARGVICRFATPDLPRDEFELLGELNLRLPEDGVLPWPYYYRQLGEDPGAWVWCHADLAGFLEDQYRRLALPRGVRQLRQAGEFRPEYSVLATHLDRHRGRATLVPVWDGRDMKANLETHQAALRGDGIVNLLLKLDLGEEWQAGLAPEALAAGFTPRLVLPSVGRGDVVVFQRMAD